MDKPVKTGFLVGYARVSTQEQNLDMQIEALRKAGVKDDNIHTEKVSGASQKREALDFAIMDLREGDTFVVWRLDRLARSMRQLYSPLDRIYAKGAFFRHLPRTSILARFPVSSCSASLASSPSSSGS